VGKGFAVYFDLMPKGYPFLSIGFYLLDPAPIQVHIWDKERHDLITPFTAYPTTTGWFYVDLSGYGVVTPPSDSFNTSFYVGFTHTVDYQPSIGVDTTNPRGHSYEWDGANFELKPDLNYMISVVLILL